MREAESGETIFASGEKAERAQAIPGVRVLFPVEANAVFIQMPPEVENEILRRGWVFYNFIAAGGSRLMCSWDTAEEDVETFAADLADAVATTPLTGQARPINVH